MLRVASIATIVFALVAILLSGHSSDAASVEIDSEGVNQSRTLHQIVKSQRRFVLYNSRQLSGECLDVCVPSPRTDPPAPDPTREPSLSPTPEPSKSPTKSPTPEPSKSPTKSPTPEPSKSPTLAPTGTMCKQQKAINVCIAIDNSGSICSVGSPRLCEGCEEGTPFDDGKCDAGTDEYEEKGGTLGSNACCGHNQMVEDFALSYIDNLKDSYGASVSVVNFASTANVIAFQDPGTKNAAKEAIKTTLYTGGWTNTENAIDKCTDEVKGLANPVIVLITDGTPTACTKNAEDDWLHDGDDTSKCRHGRPEDAAKNRANRAANEGVTLVPVVISSVDENTEFLECLARCPEGSSLSDCDVNDFKDKLHVERIDEIEQALEDLVKLTGCEDE